MSTAGRERVVVVGGVAAGMSAASQAKRRRPDLDVIVFEKGSWVSYGACGMPYNIEDPNRAIDDLVVFTPERLRDERALDVRIRHRVCRVDLSRREVWVERTGGESRFPFDQLVLATGCRAVRPAWPGVDLDGVFVLHTLEHAERIKRYLDDASVRTGAVIGGGHIGLEMADVLASRGLSVTLLKRSAGIPPGYPEEFGALVRNELQKYGVEVRTGVRILSLEGRGRIEKVETDGGSVSADIVIVATGVEPCVELAEQAGIRIGPSGAIAVDDHLRTSAGGVFAAGDCAEAYHRLLNKGVFLPRGTTANKQGRIAGVNLAGGDERFRGVVGTSVSRLLGLAIGHTGLLDHEARAAGLEFRATSIRAGTRAHSYPGAKEILVRLLHEPGSGRILGAQMAGGEGVAKRLDVVVAALHAGWCLDDLAALDLSYAPPFAPVWDPVLVAANVARKSR